MARTRTRSAYGVCGPTETMRSSGSAASASISTSKFLRGSTVPTTSANGSASGRRASAAKRASTPGYTTAGCAAGSTSARYSSAENCESHTIAAAPRYARRCSVPK